MGIDNKLEIITEGNISNIANIIQINVLQKDIIKVYNIREKITKKEPPNKPL